MSFDYTTPLSYLPSFLADFESESLAAQHNPSDIATSPLLTNMACDPYLYDTLEAVKIQKEIDSNFRPEFVARDPIGASRNEAAENRFMRQSRHGQPVDLSSKANILTAQLASCSDRIKSDFMQVNLSSSKNIVTSSAYSRNGQTCGQDSVTSVCLMGNTTVTSQSCSRTKFRTEIVSDGEQVSTEMPLYDRACDNSYQNPAACIKLQWNSLNWSSAEAGVRTESRKNSCVTDADVIVAEDEVPCENPTMQAVTRSNLSVGGAQMVYNRNAFHNSFSPLRSDMCLTADSLVMAPKPPLVFQTISAPDGANVIQEISARRSDFVLGNTATEPGVISAGLCSKLAPAACLPKPLAVGPRGTLATNVMTDSGFVTGAMKPLSEAISKSSMPHSVIGLASVLAPPCSTVGRAKKTNSSRTLSVREILPAKAVLNAKVMSASAGLNSVALISTHNNHHPQFSTLATLNVPVIQGNAYVIQPSVVAMNLPPSSIKYYVNLPHGMGIGHPASVANGPSLNGIAANEDLHGTRKPPTSIAVSSSELNNDQICAVTNPDHINSTMPSAELLQAIGSAVMSVSTEEARAILARLKSMEVKPAENVARLTSSSASVTDGRAATAKYGQSWLSEADVQTSKSVDGISCEAKGDKLKRLTSPGKIGQYAASMALGAGGGGSGGNGNASGLESNSAARFCSSSQSMLSRSISGNASDERAVQSVVWEKNANLTRRSQVAENKSPQQSPRQQQFQQRLQHQSNLLPKQQQLIVQQHPQQHRHQNQQQQQVVCSVSDQVTASVSQNFNSLPQSTPTDSFQRNFDLSPAAMSPSVRMNHGDNAFSPGQALIDVQVDETVTKDSQRCSVERSKDITVSEKKIDCIMPKKQAPKRLSYDHSPHVPNKLAKFDVISGTNQWGYALQQAANEQQRIGDVRQANHFQQSGSSMEQSLKNQEHYAGMLGSLKPNSLALLPQKMNQWRPSVPQQSAIAQQRIGNVHGTVRQSNNFLQCGSLMKRSMEKEEHSRHKVESFKPKSLDSQSQVLSTARHLSIDAQSSLLDCASANHFAIGLSRLPQRIQEAQSSEFVAAPAPQTSCSAIAQSTKKSPIVSHSTEELMQRTHAIIARCAASGERDAGRQHKLDSHDGLGSELMAFRASEPVYTSTSVTAIQLRYSTLDASQTSEFMKFRVPFVGDSTVTAVASHSSSVVSSSVNVSTAVDDLSLLPARSLNTSRNSTAHDGFGSDFLMKCPMYAAGYSTDGASSGRKFLEYSMPVSQQQQREQQQQQQLQKKQQQLTSGSNNYGCKASRLPNISNTSASNTFMALSQISMSHQQQLEEQKCQQQRLQQQHVKYQQPLLFQHLPQQLSQQPRQQQQLMQQQHLYKQLQQPEQPLLMELNHPSQNVAETQQTSPSHHLLHAQQRLKGSAAESAQQLQSSARNSMPNLAASSNQQQPKQGPNQQQIQHQQLKQRLQQLLDLKQQLQQHLDAKQQQQNLTQLHQQERGAAEHKAKDQQLLTNQEAARHRLDEHRLQWRINAAAMAGDVEGALGAIGGVTGGTAPWQKPKRRRTGLAKEEESSILHFSNNLTLKDSRKAFESTPMKADQQGFDRKNSRSERFSYLESDQKKDIVQDQRGILKQVLDAGYDPSDGVVGSVSVKECNLKDSSLVHGFKTDKLVYDCEVFESPNQNKIKASSGVTPSRPSVIRVNLAPCHASTLMKSEQCSLTTSSSTALSMENGNKANAESCVLSADQHSQLAAITGVKELSKKQFLPVQNGAKQSNLHQRVSASWPIPKRLSMKQQALQLRRHRAISLMERVRTIARVSDVGAVDRRGAAVVQQHGLDALLVRGNGASRYEHQQFDAEIKMAQRCARDDKRTPSEVLAAKRLNDTVMTDTTWVQDAPCWELTPSLARCRECRAATTSDQRRAIVCRFQAFRLLTLDADDHAEFSVSSSGFASPSDADCDDVALWMPPGKSHDNRSAGRRRLERGAAMYILGNIGERFCQLVEQERTATTWSDYSVLAWKRALQGTREMCDVCNTTIFNLHWTCGMCGYVVCVDCFRASSTPHEGCIILHGAAAKDGARDSARGGARDGERVECAKEYLKKETAGKDSARDGARKNGAIVNGTAANSGAGCGGAMGGAGGCRCDGEKARKWRSCTTRHAPHEPGDMMATQVIPSDALWALCAAMHRVRAQHNIGEACTCAPGSEAANHALRLDPTPCEPTQICEKEGQAAWAKISHNFSDSDRGSSKAGGLGRDDLERSEIGKGGLKRVELETGCGVSEMGHGDGRETDGISFTAVQDTIEVSGGIDPVDDPKVMQKMERVQSSFDMLLNAAIFLEYGVAASMNQIHSASASVDSTNNIVDDTNNDIDSISWMESVVNSSYSTEAPLNFVNNSVNSECCAKPPVDARVIFSFRNIAATANLQINVDMPEDTGSENVSGDNPAFRTEGQCGESHRVLTRMDCGLSRKRSLNDGDTDSLTELSIKRAKNTAADNAEFSGNVQSFAKIKISCETNDHGIDSSLLASSATPNRNHSFNDLVVNKSHGISGEKLEGLAWGGGIPRSSLCVTAAQFPRAPHIWLDEGRLLLLTDPHGGTTTGADTTALFRRQWCRSQPVLMANCQRRLDARLWTPKAFSAEFGHLENDLVDCANKGTVLEGHKMAKFWEGFERIGSRMKDRQGDPMILKLKDWPPKADFSDIMPSRFNDLLQALPLPEYTHRDGVYNLASCLPEYFLRPDLGPKMYNAYGSALHPQVGSTNLHLDISDAINLILYVGVPVDDTANHEAGALRSMSEAGCCELTMQRVQRDGAKPGALWHIFDPRDADRIRDLLHKVAREQGEDVEEDSDPIHDQSWYLDEGLRARLRREYGVQGYTIVQCLGDAIFIPAGAPHQVRNLHSCIKAAEDFVSPENLATCFKLTQEFRRLADTHSNHEDKLQVKNILYHAIKDAVSALSDV